MRMLRFHSIFIFIFLLGFLLRAQETLSGNFLFLLDQGRDMLAVKRILYEHHLTLIGPYTSLQGVFQGPLWYYLLAVPTYLSRGNPWGSLALMLIISLATVMVVYSLSLKFFGKRIALITSFLFAVSPEAVAAATYEWNPHPMWLLIVLYAFALFSVENGRYRSFLLLWPLIGLMFHFQTALGIFILTGTFCYFLLFNKNIIKHAYFLYGLLLGGIFFLPQLLFDLRHDFLMTKSIIKLFNGSDRGLFVKGETGNYLDIVFNHLSLFYYNFTTSLMRDGYLSYLPQVLFICMIIAIIFGKKYLHCTQKESAFINFLTKIVLIIILLSLLYPFPLRYWFLTGFQSFYLLIFGILLSKISMSLLGKVVLTFFLIVISYYLVLRIHTLYFAPPDDGGTAKTKGKLGAIDTIYRDAQGKPFNLLVFTPSVSTDPYDYLVWWYGKNKYGYLPGKEKKGVFYLLIEPDGSKIWSYKGWLETVVKTGKVLDTKRLASGFIIQKRIEE